MCISRWLSSVSAAAGGAQPPFTGYFAACRSSSVKCPYVSFARFPVELLVFFTVGFESALYILDTTPCQICGLQILSPSLWFVFLGLHTVFCGTVFYFDGIQFINLYFYGLCFQVKSLLSPGS